MVKKLPACYGIRKGRGAPVVVHSWSEVVAKVRETKFGQREGILPPPPSLLACFSGGRMGAPRPTPADFEFGLVWGWCLAYLLPLSWLVCVCLCLIQS